MDGKNRVWKTDEMELGGNKHVYFTDISEWCEGAKVNVKVVDCKTHNEMIVTRKVWWSKHNGLHINIDGYAICYEDFNDEVTS